MQKYYSDDDCVIITLGPCEIQKSININNLPSFYDGGTIREIFVQASFIWLNLLWKLLNAVDYTASDSEFTNMGQTEMRSQLH